MTRIRRKGQPGIPRGLRTKESTYSVGNTGKRELGRELDDILLQLLKQLGGLVVLVAEGGNKVLEKLVTGFLLCGQGDLDSSMQERSDGLHLGLLHGSRSQSGKTDSDTTGNLGRGVTGDGVLVDRDVTFVADLFDLRTGQA